MHYVKFMLNLNFFFVKICHVKICKDDNIGSYLNITVQIFIIVFYVPIPKKTVVATE